MDLYCERCGEPYDFHHVMHDMTPEEKDSFLTGKHCPACKAQQEVEQPMRAMVAAALHDVLGDDLDGLAAEMEDAEWCMGEDFWK